MPNSVVELQEAIERRRVAEKRANDAVLQLVDLDADSPAQILIDACRLLTPERFGDVAVERALDNRCGYPLCVRPPDMKQQRQYRIDGAERRVYDVSDRRNFCSDQCCLQSKFVERQILDAPVWAVDARAEQNADVRLLSSAEAARGRKGAVVPLGAERLSHADANACRVAESVAELSLNSES